MVPEVLKEAEERMKKSVEATRHDFNTVRTGRATPELVEHVKVEAYGQEQQLQHVAAVSVPEPRQLLITPWDRAMLSVIEKAILKSDLHITPTNDGQNIRLNIPALTEERRKDLIKQVHGKAEAGRVAVRNVRHDAVKKLQAARKAKENPLSENEEKRALDSVQKLADKYVAEVDALMKAKEAALTEV